MKYKVGDKVKIRSLDWYKANKNKKGIIPFYRNSTYTMSYYCGKIAKIINVKDKSYSINLDNGLYSWPDEMFEENINDMETKEIIIPQGWEIDEVRGNKELPKTWEECCKLLGKGEFIGVDSDIINFNNTIGKPMLALCKLLICREVYRQGWKPNWKDGKEIKWTIECIEYRISSMICTYCSKVLSFQSEEIRDKFLENFKDLIEEAKELI